MNSKKAKLIIDKCREVNIEITDFPIAELKDDRIEHSMLSFIFLEECYIRAFGREINLVCDDIEYELISWGLKQSDEFSQGKKIVLNPRKFYTVDNVIKTVHDTMLGLFQKEVNLYFNSNYRDEYIKFLSKHLDYNVDVKLINNELYYITDNWIIVNNRKYPRLINE